MGFVAYLVSDSFAAVTAWTVWSPSGRTAFWGSYGNIVAAISVPGERERWFGFLGALRNIGFALGGLVSGLAITIGTQAAYTSVVVANAVSFAVAFVLLLAVPATERSAHERRSGSWRTVLRDGPYRVLWLAQLIYSTVDDGAQLRAAGLRDHGAGPARVGDRRRLHHQHDHGRLGPGDRGAGDDRPVRWRILLLSNVVFAARTSSSSARRPWASPSAWSWC